mmetsp:Transcript_64372/g.153532  ORF Transcript_64372/g.153532 Transcript_64372/m.153532 type:complete len:299 (+) Transcript_64372:1702-2598(+)
MLPVDARLTSQPYLLIFLGSQLSLVHLLELLDFSVCILLQLRQGLLVLLKGAFLLLDDAVALIPHVLLLPVVICPHLVNDAIVAFGEAAVLHLPLLLFSLKVLLQLLVALHLNEHLLLEGLLQLLRLLRVQLLQRFDAFLVLNLHVALLFAKHLVLAPLRLDLFAVLLLELRHLLFVIAVSVPQLEVDSVCELLHLALKLQQSSLLIIQEDSRDQNFICEAKGPILVPFAGLLLHVPDVQASIICSTEEVLLIASQSYASDRARMRLELRIVTIQGEVVAPQRPRTLELRHASEKHLV